MDRTVQNVDGLDHEKKAHEIPFSGDPGPGVLLKNAGIPLETIVFKRIDGLELGADIYYPAPSKKALPTKARPIALLIHGGSHFLLTRKEVPVKHVKALLKRGFLPVSVDFRLCPELPLAKGGVPDILDALYWVRNVLPRLQRARPEVLLNASQVMAAGWSSGGQLAMIMGYLAPDRGIKPPEVIVSFYGMCDLESDWWRTPVPISWALPYSEDDLLRSVEEKPTAGTSPERVAGVGRNPIADNPRGRFAIHVFLKAQMVPILVNGLPTRAKAKALRSAGDTTNWMIMPEPPIEQVRAISPYAQILIGNYRVPTFFAHGDNDQEVPMYQSRDAAAALRASNIDAGFAIARGAGHSFDFRPEQDPLQSGWAAAQEAYNWAQSYIKF